MKKPDSPPKFEYRSKRNYMDCEFDLTFKIDSDCDLEVLCNSEIGLSFLSEKLNIKESNLDLNSFISLIKKDENWKLEGDFIKNELTITIFKVIKLNLQMVKANENNEKIIQYLYKKVNHLSKEVNNLKECLSKEKEKGKEEIKVIPLTFANGWNNYNDGYATGKIIKKGNEITLSGLIKGTNFSNVCVLPEDCRPKQRLIFSLNHHNIIMRFDICPDGNLAYVCGTNSQNWISLDGIHFFAGI